MFKKLWRYPLTLLTVLALAGAATWALTASQADADCGPCGGPKRYAYGFASGCSSSATAAAKSDAIGNAFGTPAGCIPCGVQTVYSGCAAPYNGQGWSTTVKISYKCQSCSIPPRPDRP